MSSDGTQPRPVDVAPPAAPAEDSTLSDRARYRIEGEGERRLIRCDNLHSSLLHVERGLSVTEEERDQFPERSIFLDGAYCGPAFLDNKARQYSLDHHTGCIRGFTLATCEQAAVMLLEGLPLDKGTWHLYINDPDLDALMAAWVLLNHAELRADGARLLALAMPYLRVEGNIDALGKNRAVLSGLGAEDFALRSSELDRLIEGERAIKAQGTWGTTDLVTHSHQMLEGLDRLLFPETVLLDLRRIVEVDEVKLGKDRVAVLCHSGKAIYDVEQLLKERHDKRLGVIVLSQGNGRYTLRQVDRFLDKDLTALYEELNHRDPKVGQVDGDDNRWGGSNDIGGSPRKTGSGLEAEEILKIVGRVHSPNWLRKITGKLGF